MDELRAGGFEPLALALINIKPLALGPTDLNHSAAPAKEPINADFVTQLSNYSAWVFVSRSAVVHFFNLLRDSNLIAPTQTACWATGQGTAHTLKAYGVTSERIISPPTDAAQFDSAQLWASAAAHISANQRVLFIRGVDTPALTCAANLCDGTAISIKPFKSTQQNSRSGSSWLMHKLVENAVHVDYLDVYTRELPAWGPDQLSLARSARTAPFIWIFTSSLAAVHLAQLLPTLDWSRARALATHDRIAASLKELRFGVVQTSRPSIKDMISSLKSFD